VRASRQPIKGSLGYIRMAQAGALTGRQLPPLSSVPYGIISGRRSVLAA
jgi:hypothetical protein